MSGTGSPVHPRVRGERKINERGIGGMDGSSPRARGTASDWLSPFNSRRFIPACAGNGIAAAPSECPMPVHPRVRGERISRYARAVAGVGSSPRARGTVRRQERGREQARFIPACAGNGPTYPYTRSLAAVHPRVRGERDQTKAPCSARAGSSPRARGTAIFFASVAAPRRFIPACAGNGSGPLPLTS